MSSVDDTNSEWFNECKRTYILQRYWTFEVMILDCNLFCEISFSLGYLMMYKAYLYTLGH